MLRFPTVVEASSAGSCWALAEHSVRPSQSSSSSSWSSRSTGTRSSNPSGGSVATLIVATFGEVSGPYELNLLLAAGFFLFVGTLVVNVIANLIVKRTGTDAAMTQVLDREQIAEWSGAAATASMDEEAPSICRLWIASAIALLPRGACGSGSSCYTEIMPGARSAGGRVYLPLAAGALPDSLPSHQGPTGNR
jgi:hypothetical protein